MSLDPDADPAAETDDTYGPLVTVSGPPGCGATTIGEGLARRLECQHVSGGDIVRELAAERDMGLTQFLALADEDDEIDRQVDRRLQSIVRAWGESDKPFVLQSRLAGWLAGQAADFRVWLDAPTEVRMARKAGGDETQSELRVREVAEVGRYKSYYGIDVSDRSFYDIHLNTARWDVETTLDVIEAGIDGYDPAADEGAFDTDLIV
jgi:cytidylate kinase